jgi:serine phosphatase RsbU (regulator of sigma subunit)/DNA-binding NarL/FixJ family response regulator
VNGQPGALLLVEDDEAKRYVLATWLRRAGHTVTEVGTGTEALAMVASAELVVLDVHLPDMTGFEVCRRIKDDPETAAIPVIQVSATAVEVSDRAHGLTQGADAYLTDPTEPEELLALVTAALRYHRARQRAERTARLLSGLTTVTMEINAAETFDGLARAAARGAARIFGTEAVLTLQMPDGQIRRVAGSPERAETASRGGAADMADRVAERAALGPRHIVAIAAVDKEDWQRIVPDTTLRTDVYVAAARTKPDKPPVALIVPREGLDSEEERQILRQLVQSVALGVDALRSYAEEHLIALTLQRSFLPTALPAIPELAMAVRYMPASDAAQVGGDFYEALEVGDRVLIAIGDVQGHSLRAAVIMGELRHALRAFASEGHPPLVITRLLNNVLVRYHPDIIATLSLVLLHPATGELELVSCGHIPMLLVADTGATYHGEGGILLGVHRHKPFRETAVLPPGGTLVLVTDGLIEDRGISLDVNLDKLRVAAEASRDADVETLSNQLISMFGSREDDVAMIVVRRL